MSSSRIRVQFRRYRLPFRTAVRTAHGLWREREGLIVRIEDGAEGVGFGEVAPLPEFGTETADAAAEALRTIGEWPTAETLAAVPVDLGCVRHALVAAQERESPAVPSRTRLGVAALVPAGPGAMEVIKTRAESGFRVFKWKVGVADLADELALLDDVCAVLPSGGKLRLDANGAWDRRKAERWLERCAERPIEYVEQPCLAARGEGEAAQKRMEDLLLGLAGSFPTPLALDESVAGDGDVERWLAAGWPGLYVIKPLLMGDLPAALDRLTRAKADVVFSSALETAVGARTALRAAFAWPGETRALGFGVWPLFADARCDGPFAAPSLRWEDVEALTPEAVWNALS